MKYNFKLDLEGNNSLSIIIGQLKRETTVLEFGPANGRLTRYMKEELDCQVYLVELDEQAGKEALAFGQDLVLGDIEQYEWVEKYKDIKFDHIIFADVLEHLRNPLKVLQTAKQLLKEEGTILLSVPNLAHNSVLIDLMNNKFKYNAIGLLDDTHIHFFTKTSLDQMIRDAELYVKKEMATYAKVGTIEIQNTVEDVKEIKSSHWNNRPYGTVYQYVYEVVKKETETEKTIQEPKDDYYVQVYFDKNGQWTEEKSVVSVIDVLQDSQKVMIKLPEKADNFRIDPLNVECMVRINGIIGMAGEETVAVQRVCSNEACVSDEVYCFPSADPMLLYKAEKEIDFIQIEYEILDINISRSTFRPNSMELLFNSINGLKEQTLQLESEEARLRRERDSLEEARQQMLADKELLLAEIENLRNDNEAIRQTALMEKQRADGLQAQRDRLESRRVYKIYKFLKRK